MTPESAEAVLVSSADIARLTGLGRAAVSNWRRRHDDFPQPAGGTANSPLFALPEVETWLARQGKPVEVTPEERLWQLIRTGTDDLRLGDMVGELGREAYLSASGDLRPAIRRLRARQGPDTYEYLVRRLVESHARRVVPTPPETARLMALVTGTAGRDVYDPACGIGALLLAAQERGARRLAGQDRERYAADITHTRLHLRRSGEVHIAAGDSLTGDAFPADRFDAALCDAPFGDRTWGYDELTGDPRWTHGLPPRGEPELAWVQHILWHLRPGGQAAVLMPPTAADRRSGRRIRSRLLRTGTLRAVIELSPGAAAGSSAAPHLWLLRRPADGDPPPGHVLMLDAAPLPAAEVYARWKSFQRHPGGSSGSVPLIDLLDDVVDLAPGTHLHGAATIRFDHDNARDRVRRRLDAVNALATALTPLTEAAAGQKPAALAELVQDGVLEILSVPLTMDLGAGDIPVLTGKDIALRRAPSGRTTDAPGLLMLRPGDVVVPQTARRFQPHVTDLEGVAAGPQVQVLRADPQRCDPYFLACALRATALTRASSTASRADARTTRIPRLPIAAQRSCGAAYQRLADLSGALRDLVDAGDDMIALAMSGLGRGHLRPDD